MSYLGLDGGGVNFLKQSCSPGSCKTSQQVQEGHEQHLLLAVTFFHMIATGDLDLGQTPMGPLLAPSS